MSSIDQSDDQLETENAPESSDGISNAWIPSLSLAGSVMLHLCLLGLIAAVIAPGFVDGSPQVITIIDGDTILPADVDFEPALSLSGGFRSTDQSAELSTVAMLGAATSISDETKVVKESDGEAIAFTNENSLPDGSMLQGVRLTGGGKAGAGTGRGKGTGSGSGDGDGDGDGSGKGRFFGIKTKAKSVVFVVDASRSMNLPHSGPARTRFNRVKEELYKTVSAMSEKEQFFIVFFGDDAIPMPARAMMYADEANKRLYLEWLVQVQAVGHTFPENALMLALNLQPDAIYFLTDGYFDPAIARGLTLTNKKGIPVHTIGFNDNRAESVLLEIAQKNHGTYTFIPGDEAEGADDDKK